MNHEVPKVVREVLAHQTAGVPHVSSDILNAYLERSLTSAEKEQVQSHLAACSECREVMFLASGLADEPAVFPAASSSAWTWRRWRWVVPAMALFAIVSAILVQNVRRASQPKPVIMATAQAPMPLPNRVPQQPTTVAPTAKSNADTEKHSLHLESQNNIAQLNKPANGATPSSSASIGALGGRPLNPSAAAAMRVDAPTAKPAEDGSQDGLPADSIEGSLLKVAPGVVAGAPARNGFRQEEGTPPTTAAITSAMKMQWRSSWRIGEEGYLERSVGSNMWWPVKVDDTTKFRVVSVVGNDVWAGGDGGALFHSPDAGVTWSRVSLNSGDKVEKGTVISIRFATAEQGKLATEAGSHWSTSDGGRTWVKQ